MIFRHHKTIARNINGRTRMSVPVPQWYEQAVCTSVDPESWYPEKGGPAADAKRICRSCPVREECLQYAINNHETFGIWGGLSEWERRQARRASS